MYSYYKELVKLKGKWFCTHWFYEEWKPTPKARVYNLRLDFHLLIFCIWKLNTSLWNTNLFWKKKIDKYLCKYQNIDRSWNDTQIIPRNDCKNHKIYASCSLEAGRLQKEQEHYNLHLHLNYTIFIRKCMLLNITLTGLLVY